MEEETVENKIYPNDTSIKGVILKLGEWYRYLISKWITIILFTIIGSVIGVAYALIRKPSYIAATTFVLEESDKGGGGLGQYAGLASMVGVDLGGGGTGIFQGDNILELYKSRTMIEKTLLTQIDYRGRKILLIDRYIDFNHTREKWKKYPNLKNIHFNPVKQSVFDLSSLNFTRLQDSVLGSIVDEINDGYLYVYKPDKKLSMIRAEVKAKDEFFAKTFNKQIVKNVNDFYIQTKTKKSLINISILQQKTDSVRNVMNGAIYKAVQVTDATPNLNITRQIQRMAPVQRSQFTAETNKEVLGELVKNLELSKISLLKETPLIQVIDYPILPLKEEKTTKLKGLIIGGILTGFFTMVILIFRKIYFQIING
jgi:hypothetical protein